MLDIDDLKARAEKDEGGVMTAHGHALYYGQGITKGAPWPIMAQKSR
jgi:hypothetical protein